MKTDKKFPVLYLQVLIFCSLLFALSCTKESEKMEVDYPRVAPASMTVINMESTTFSSSFLQAGNSEVIDHGFVFSSVYNSPTVQNDETISLGPSSGEGTFSTTVSDGLVYAQIYYVSAYARNKDMIFYSEPVSFTAGVQLETLSPHGETPMQRCVVLSPHGETLMQRCETLSPDGDTFSHRYEDKIKKWRSEQV